MCNEITASNGELPTTTLDNGFEATVVAGTSNPHLSVRKAMGCPIARSYFVKAFVELSDADKVGFIDATNLNDFAILTAMVVDDFGSMAMFAYLQAGSMEQAQEFVTYIAEKVTDKIGDTEEAHKAFAGELDAYYTSTWLPLIQADKFAERMEKELSRGADGDGEGAAELAELLGLIAGLR